MNETDLRIPTNKIQDLTTEGRAYIILANHGLRIPRAFPSTFPVVFHSQKRGKSRKEKCHS